MADGTIDEHDEEALAAATDRLIETRLSEVSRTNPTFATVLRAYRRAMNEGELATADTVDCW